MYLTCFSTYSCISAGMVAMARPGPEARDISSNVLGERRGALAWNGEFEVGR
jgi:hypothetical protein